MRKWIILCSLSILTFWISLVYGGPKVIPVFHLFEQPDELSYLIQLRLPRTLLVFFAGAGLAVSGAVCQSVFRNPMAEPGILGIQSAAAFTAVTVLALNLDTFGPWTMPVFSGLGCLCITFLLLLFHGKSKSVDLTLLTGVAFGLLFAAMTTFILALHSHDYKLGNSVLNWLMGDFEGRGWQHLQIMLSLLLPAFLGLAFSFYGLDLLHLGEDSAASLGLQINRFYHSQIIILAVITGTITALCGSIGFLGLIVPHMLRPFLGAFHKQLLAGSAILGGTALLIVDSLNRYWVNIHLPPGAFLSMIGAPFFLWLLFYYHPSRRAT